MDDNNSKNKSNRCWGVTDLDEDEEAYNVYNISKEKVKAIGFTTGFNKSPEELSVPIVEKKKRSKPKSKPNVSTAIDETKRQLASFTFSHNPVEENGDINTNKSPLVQTVPTHFPKPVEEIINKTTEIKDNKSINVPIYQSYTANQFPQQTRSILTNHPLNDFNTAAMMYQANLMRMTTSPQLPYSNYCAPVRCLQQQNPYLSFVNPAMKSHQAPRMVNYQQPNTTKTTYYERLDVIEVLFRFIMQILRSPEQPSVEQVEEIKNLLDSLVVKTNETHLT